METESKTMVKLAHVVAFLLLVSAFQPLTARDLKIEMSDGSDALQFNVSQFDCPGVTKVSWPELLGTPAKLARLLIQKENPRFTYIPGILNGLPWTLDFSCNRVRFAVNVLDVVVGVPRFG